jgi:hypothetical protein
MSFKLFHVLYEAGSKWVKMNVTHQFQQVDVLLAQNRLVAVLEEVAVSTVSAVIPKGVTGQKPSHDRRDGNCSGPEQEVKMIGNKCPGIATCFGFFQDTSESNQKIVSVGIVLEYLSSFNAPGNDVVEGSRSIYS